MSVAVVITTLLDTTGSTQTLTVTIGVPASARWASGPPAGLIDINIVGPQGLTIASVTGYLTTGGSGLTLVGLDTVLTGYGYRAVQAPLSTNTGATTSQTASTGPTITKADDGPLSPTAGKGTLGPSIGPSTTIASESGKTTTANGVSSLSSVDSHRGVSPGAVAGLVIGILLAVALVIGVVFFVLRRRKIKRAGVAPELVHDKSSAGAPAAITDYEIEKPAPGQETTIKTILRKAHALTGHPGAAPVSAATDPKANDQQSHPLEPGDITIAPSEPAKTVAEPHGPIQTRSTEVAPPYSTVPNGAEGLTTSSATQDSDIARIEEEINRLDQEISERERLQDLKDQRARLAARLRDARG